MEIITQLVGGIGVLASVISFQCKKHNKILLFRTLNEAFFALQYFLLGAYTGMVMNIIGCIRNIIFSKQVERGKNYSNSINLLRIVFCVGCCSLAGT